MAHDEGGVFIQFAVDHGQLVGDCDTLALGPVVRLGDVGHPWVFVHLLLQQVKLLREDEGLGQEVKVTHAMSDLHPGEVLVHEVFAGEMEGVGEVVDLLVGQQSLVHFVLYHRRRPVQSPVLICYRTLKPILVQPLLYQLHLVILELVEVANLVVFCQVAHLGKGINLIVLPARLLPLLLLDSLDLLLDDVHLLVVAVVLPRPGLEPQGFRKLVAFNGRFVN